MGFLSDAVGGITGAVSGALGDIVGGIFGDPSAAIGEASQAQLAYQQQALDYLREIQALPLELRDQAMQQLMGFYSGDPETQQQFIDAAKASPFYQSMIEQGQEGVLRNAGAMGLSRSGRAATGLERSNQNVLQSLVGQRLQGLQGFAGMPVGGQDVAGVLQGMGQTVGSAGVAQANAQQAMTGQLLGGLTSIGSMLAFSDPRLKKNKQYLYSVNGHKIYSWEWNQKGRDLGLYGKGIGVMSNEVREKAPHAVSQAMGYDIVDYKVLGVV